MYRAMKFRLYPSESQKNFFEKTFGSCRFVYNYFLAKEKEYYKETGKYLSYKDCCADLVTLKRQNPFLKDADSVALQQSLRHLDKAFQNFFRNKNMEYPRFKSKKNHHDSYSTMKVHENIRVEGTHIVLPKAGKVRIKLHRLIPESYTLKSVTVSRTPSGKYYASLSFEYENQVPEKKDKKSLGLDFAVKGLYVDSNGLRCNYPGYFQKSETMLAREQRKLAHMVKGSHNYEKQRIKVARIHEHVANQRKDFLHKKSRELAETYGNVIIENLDMKKMTQEKWLGKFVWDNSWGQFCRFLEYKLSDRGGLLIRIDRYFPSSQRCSYCGALYQETKNLSVREWDCPVCGKHHNRDHNAAKNILQEGLRLMAA